MAAKGALFGDRGGWERATWFARPGDNPDDHSGFQRPSWYDAVAEECTAVAERVGILDLHGFAKFEVSGPGAEQWLDHMIIGSMPKLGRISLSYFCNEPEK